MPSGPISVALLAAGIATIVLGAEAFFDGFLGAARRIGLDLFPHSSISGLEIENIAAGRQRASLDFRERRPAPFSVARHSSPSASPDSVHPLHRFALVCRASSS